MRDKSLYFLLLGLLVLGLLLGSYEEFWKQGAKKVSTDIVTVDNNSKQVNLEIIWDASGSMWGRETGIEKIIRSKEVLKTFTSEIPENINIGLRIFGARRVGDLEDSFLAVPIDDDNRDEIVNFITNVKPLGKSPIGYSLAEAEKDLAGVEGKKFIILISDGIENGQIPGEKIIKNLQNSKIVLHIVHIGNINDEKLKEKLKELAEKTGGSYFTYTEQEKVIPTLSQTF